MDRLITWDESLFHTLNAAHTPWLDPVMWFFSNIPVWIPLYLFIAFCFFYSAPSVQHLPWKQRFDWKWGVAGIVGMLLVFLLTDQVSGFIKDAVQRLRPSHREEWTTAIHLLEHKGGLYSFVSSHAANCFGLATFSSLVLRRKKFTILIFAWALLVGYSRIYVGKHFPGDVICGLVLGILLGCIGYFLYRKITSCKWFSHALPH